MSAAPPSPAGNGHPRASTLALTLGALGVVYGDIGTSPLYALRECFSGPHALAVTEGHVLGVLSLVAWSLICVVSIQYLVFILRADNRGEGGIFALLALVPAGKSRGGRGAVTALALAGAALLCGEGAITPAISVLAAVEGLEVAVPAAHPFVVPLAFVILILLFAFQSRGTGHIGRVFGPVMAVWFLTIAVLGLIQVAEAPGVLRALNPWHAAAFLAGSPGTAFVVLGAVVLCITGVEALYTDMGHFGRRPIRMGWYALVLPSLMLSYFGQGALLLERPDVASRLFFAQVPPVLLLPMVALATFATIVASQALISGMFSLARQAVQLGYLPRLGVVHTSSLMEGQIYLSVVNWLLAAACLGLVLEFRSSASLAAAYGIAVTGAMSVSALVFGVVARRRWGWSLWRVVPLVAVFLAFSLTFLASCLLKVAQGGWITLVLAASVFLLMRTWKRGREEIRVRFVERTMTLDAFVESLAARPVHRVEGAAVFLSSSPTMAPVALLHHVLHSRVLHRNVLVICFQTLDVPLVAAAERLDLKPLPAGIWKATVRLGFMQTPDVVSALKLVGERGAPFPEPGCTYYLSRESLLVTGPSRMAGWRKRLFAFATRNAQTPANYFGLPPGRVVELGVQIDL